MKVWGKLTIVLAAIVLIASGCVRYREPISSAANPTGPGLSPDGTLNGTQLPEPGPVSGDIPQKFGGAPSPDKADYSVLPKIYFDYDRAVIRESERGKLEKIAGWLKEHPQQGVLIAGNCDERGTEEYNRALGERRANAAREYLVRLGIDASRIGTISYGKDRPVEPGHNGESWALNRRDEFGVGNPQAASALP